MFIFSIKIADRVVTYIEIQLSKLSMNMKSILIGELTSEK